MLSSRFCACVKAGNIRNFSRTMTLNDTNKNINDQKPRENPVMPQYVVNKAPLTKFDKWLMVWVKQYPTKADVPNELPHPIMEHARSKARIKVCTYLMVITIILFIFKVNSAKKVAAEREQVLHSLARTDDPEVK